jgi:signal transduction histidine kinase
MQQALLNLLQNALDATPAGGQITLSADISKDTLRIVVADNGVGMSPAVLERIFDLYYTTKPHGTGLGLSITQQIIGQHGGTIEVSSVEDRGTTFTVNLPHGSSTQTGTDEFQGNSSGLQTDSTKS